MEGYSEKSEKANQYLSTDDVLQFEVGNSNIDITKEPPIAIEFNVIRR